MKLYETVSVYPCEIKMKPMENTDILNNAVLEKQPFE